MKDNPDLEAQTHALLDVMVELYALENRIRQIRESIDPTTDKMYQVWLKE